MKSLDNIAEDLFNKIRGRFPSVTIGDAEGKVTNDPLTARFFDFDYKEGDRNVGKVSLSVSEDKLSVMYSNSFVEDEDDITRQKWYDFLKELRVFAKKRLLQFDTRDITKSNLDKRDYKFLAQQQGGDEIMSESKMYGTSRHSYQDIGNARISIKHTESVNQELTRGRTQKIGAIYVESAEGERFKYPYKHLNGARAMARHVAEGGKPYDDFGKHITGLSEELANLKKFKTYMSRSAVMAEGLSGYLDAVVERLGTIKKTVSSLQKESYYKEAIDGFEASVIEEVPNDVAENWIDELTVRQFNEELKDVFPYVYRLVSEVSKAKELGPDEIDEGPIDWMKDKFNNYRDRKNKEFEQEQKDLELLKTVISSAGYDDATIRKVEQGCLNDPRVCLYNMIRKNDINPGDMDMEVVRIGKELNSGFTTFSGTVDEAHPNSKEYDKCWDGYEKVPGKKRGEKGSCVKAEDIENAVEELMGQFAEGVEMCPEECCGKPVTECSCGPDCPHCDCYEKNKKNESKTEGNKFSMALKKAKDDDEDEMEVGGKKIPVTEFILSLFDRETGQFPKGETAVLTAIEKDYGEQYINPAKAFIEAINAKFEEFNGYKDPETNEGFDPEHFDGEFDYEAVGDDGESTDCTVSYTATIIDGKPVVHPKSISLNCPMDGNSKLGYDADMDLEMQDMDEIMQMAQEDADEQWAERDDKYAQGAFETISRIKNLAGL